MRKPIGWVALMATLAFTQAYAQKAETAQETYKIDGKEIELARYAKAFIGSGNVTVEVAPYKMGSKEGAILLFHGIEGEWDGKAVNHRVLPGSYNGTNYVTQRDGKDWTTLIGRPDYEGKWTYTLYVPGVQEELKLAPSDGAAQLTNPRKIFQEYQRQQNPRK
jgi:hypothetical protein